MRSGFAKGVLVGGIIATSVGMIMNSDKVNSGSKRRIMRNGRMLMRKSGNIISDMVDMFR